MLTFALNFQALVLAPTRELARQIHTVILALGDYLQVDVYLVVGGEKVGEMARRLSSGVQVVVGKLDSTSRSKHNYIQSCM